jgi:hypothetical protein
MPGRLREPSCSDRDVRGTHASRCRTGNSGKQTASKGEGGIERSAHPLACLRPQNWPVAGCGRTRRLASSGQLERHSSRRSRAPASGRVQAVVSGGFRAVQLQNGALPTELGIAVITSLRHTLVTACAGPSWHTAFIAQVMSIAVSSPFQTGSDSIEQS